jgi:hypothetical protein
MSEKVLKEFARSMRKKYGNFANPENTTPKTPASFSRGRFTGNGMDGELQSSEPAGVVHEGEFVVNASEVNSAGGPKRVQQAVDQAVVNNDGGVGPVPEVEAPPSPEGFRRGGYVKPGYQIGGPVLPNVGTPPTIPTGPNPPGGPSTAPPLAPTNPGPKPTNFRTPGLGAIAGRTQNPAPSNITLTESGSLPTTEIPVETIAQPKSFTRVIKPETSVETLAPKPKPITVKLDKDGNVIQDVTEEPTPDLTPAPEIDTEEKLRDPTITNRITRDPREVVETKAEDLLQTDLSDSARALGFQELQDEQIEELRNIADGEGTAAGIAGRIARDNLALSQAAGNQAAAQAMAQSGLTGGELAVAQARQRKQNAIVKSGLEGQLAIDAVNRAEAATMALASIAERGQQFEEMKRQFGANFDLSKANFGLSVEQFNEFKNQFSDNFGLQVDQMNLSIDNANEARLQFKENMDLAWNSLSENMRQFDNNTALQMFLNDSRVNMWKADTLMLAGDYNGATQVYKDMGINVDFSNLQDKQSQETFGNAIANLDADLDLLPEDMNMFEGENFTAEGLNTDAASDLIRAWNAQHPDEKVTVANANQNRNFKQWAENTYNARIAQKSPYYSMVQSFSDDELSNVILGITDFDSETGEQVARYSLNEQGQFVDKDGNEFEYAGVTGVDGMRTAYSNLFHTGGLRANPDGSLAVDTDNPIWESFGLTQKAGSPEDIQSDRINTFITSGDPSKMEGVDWDKFFSDTNNIVKAKENGSILKVTEMTDNIGHHDRISTSDAKKKFQEANPYKEGDIIEYKGVFYKITNPTFKHDAGKDGTTVRRDVFRIQLKGIPLTGPDKGTEQVINSSSKYMPG